MNKIILALPLALALSACSVSVDPGSPPSGLRDHDVRLSAGGAGAACGTASAAEIAAALAATNAIRSRSGLALLSHDPRLSAAAADQACNMAKAGVMTHAGPGEDGPRQRAARRGYGASIIAENVAAGPWDVGASTATWAASHGHLANISLRQARHFGVGSAKGANGETYLSGLYAAGR